MAQTCITEPWQGAPLFTTITFLARSPTSENRIACLGKTWCTRCITTEPAVFYSGSGVFSPACRGTEAQPQALASVHTVQLQK